jgi:hypothetical protein
MMVTRSARLLFVLHGSAFIALSAGMACTAGDPASPSYSGSSWIPLARGVDAQAETHPDSDTYWDGPSDTPFDMNAEIATDVVEASCPRGDLPDACPSPAPSWMNDVQGIVNHRCSPCHFPGGVEFPRVDFSSYAKVHQSFGSILNNVYACIMPPPDAAAPTPEERKALLAWLVCMAPDN